MKKITLLALAALTLVLVSCGVNSLNPEKFELKKLPVWDATIPTTPAFKPAFNPTGPTLNLYAETKGYTITTEADTYTVEGFKNNLPSVLGPNATATGTGVNTTDSHVAYSAKTLKDSEIFTPFTSIAITDGKITIPPAASAELAGGKFKIWVIEIVRK